MFDTSKYKNNLPYLTKKDCTTVVDVQFKGQIKQVSFVDENKLKESHKLYNEETARLHAQFKDDLFEYYGVTEHYKADLVFEKAWSAGHADGYDSVVNWFGDLVELIQ